MSEQEKKLTVSIEKDVSYVMGVPREVEEIYDIGQLVERLKTTDLFEFDGLSRGEEGNPIVHLIYEGEAYDVMLILEDVEISPMYTVNHHFSDEDFESLNGATQGITTAMHFGEDIGVSYLVQLKVIAALMPDLLAVVDYSAQRVYAGTWVALAANSKVPPSPNYIYSIQAVSDEEEDVVWLHTHGLNRCGKIELEVLNSQKAYHADHANILQGMANRLMDGQDELEEGEAIFAAYYQGKIPLIATWIPWFKAVGFYDEEMLGGSNKREEHEGPSGAIFLYLSKEDYEEGKFVPLSVLEDQLQDNVMVMFTVKETERMRSLARERFEYFRKYIQNPENHGIIKFGLLVDEEFNDESGDKREHIWFEILDIAGDKMKAKLTQAPYMIKGLREGDVLELDVEEMTDWLVYTPEFSINPDNIYLMER